MVAGPVHTLCKHIAFTFSMRRHAVDFSAQVIPIFNKNASFAMTAFGAKQASAYGSAQMLWKKMNRANLPSSLAIPIIAR